jgi:hypothetical protein
LLSASPAHARPNFELTEPGARAGDPVHFSISGADGAVTYELEIDDTDVLEGTGSGAVTGTFTVPDLGQDVRTVKVEAEIRAADKRKKVKRKLEYLGSALPVAGPPAPVPPAIVPAATPHPAASPEPVYLPNAVAGASPAPRVTPRSSPRPRQSRKRHAVEQPRHVGRRHKSRRGARRGRDSRNHDAAARKRRPKHPGPRTAPLFDGIPEPGAGDRPGDGGGVFSLNAIAPRGAVLAATRVRPGDSGGLDAALVVPALLGLAGLALAGTAALRRRQLASARRRD